MKYILYDLEIKNAIPDKSPIPGIEYCGGWNDHGNMGISVIGFCEILTGDDNPASLLDAAEAFGPLTLCANPPDYLIGDDFGLEVFAKLVREADGLIGFNSRNFDDKVMAAHGYPMLTTYDLLEEARIAAYGSPSFQSAPKGHSYKLAHIGDANGHPKTGDGANAAIAWQSGQHRSVIDYCCNDVAITAALLRMGLGGNLKDPNTGKMLQLRALE
jgi:hypothetical protein